ncbi:YvrJ family protein [Priestia flexa]|uniref:YvrJ family protein n=1 Tax=Priestia TaxID=2800373 RepID=UPI00196B2AF3|nr:YvrJ family protein [Priestia flexa]
MPLIESWLNVIANVGFPIAVAFYLLIRFEKKIDDLTKTINHIATIIEEKKKDAQ